MQKHVYFLGALSPLYLSYTFWSEAPMLQLNNNNDDGDDNSNNNNNNNNNLILVSALCQCLLSIHT